MKTNEGTLDRILRVIAGLALVALAFTGTIGAWGWLGLVLVATGAIGWCGMYTLLGINTCGIKPAK